MQNLTAYKMRMESEAELQCFIIFGDESPVERIRNGSNGAQTAEHVLHKLTHPQLPDAELISTICVNYV